MGNRSQFSPVARQRLYVACIALALGVAHFDGHAQTSENPLDRLFKGIGGVLSNIFSVRTQKLKELVDSKKFREAAEYYESEKTQFDSDESAVPVLSTLAAGLNAERVPELQTHLRTIKRWTADVNETEKIWRAVREALQGAQRSLDQYEEQLLLRDSKFRAPEVASLSDAKSQLERLYVTRAAAAFQKFNHLRNTNFFDVYPVSVNSGEVVRAGFDSVLSSLAVASPQDISAFRGRYASALADRELTSLGNIYVERKLHTLGATAPGFFDKWQAVKEARDAGFKVTEVKGLRIVVFYVAPESESEATRWKQISIDQPNPLRVVKASEIQSNSDGNAANFIVLVRAMPLEINRKVTDKRQESSRVQVGTRTLPNPEYAAAQAKFIQAQSEYNNTVTRNSLQPAYGAAAGFLRGLGEGILANAVTEARNQLAATSPTVSEAVYEDYQFNVSRVEATRSTKFRLWVIDKEKRSVARHEVATSEGKTFEIAYNLRDKDPDIWSYRNRYEQESAVDAWEKGTLSVKYPWLANELLRAAPTFIPMKSEAEIIAEASVMIASRTPVTSLVNAQAALADDPRVDSVVVVKNPRGSFGAGFFIAPGLILTNYHVVEGSQIPEIRLRNGQVVVGRVTKSDIGLDLALISVSVGGTPVQFSSTPLAVGATVEAIGHPQGLEFSITRGIVSAIRKMKNNLVKGSREMLLVQTDAAISPGNSGGPLFQGTRVVGVNSQKLIRTGAEGLGFAVHYIEVMRFIQEP